MTNRYPPRITALRPQIRPLAFFTHMALATGLVMALPTPVHAQASRHYDIPAGPLDAALNRFALQAGIALVIDAEKLKGLRSAGLQGDYDVDTGFAALLRNTGYNVARTPSGYILVEAPKASAAPIAGTGETQLPTLVVTDVREPMGTTVIDRRTIEAMPAGNGDITSLLKIHPNVQFDNKQMSSNSPGEISAADISINGAKYYQNAFTLDGMNINNDIDPGERTASRINSLSDVPGQSQGLSLDADLLENITVHDSNVPAAYGRFTGGVVEASTRKPTRELHGKFSVQTTRSSWTRYHLDKQIEESFENSADIYDQPKFDKMIYRGTLEGYLTENFGLLANFSQKRSTIPTSFYSANNVAAMGLQERDQKRSIDNYFVKAVWKPISRLDLESSITYAPEENTYWRGNIANSAFENHSGGLQLNLKARYDGDLVKLEQNLGYGKLESSKRSDSDDYYAWRRSTSKFWGVSAASSLEGGYGDIDQTQDTWQYRLNADWQAFSLLGGNHRLQSGMEISRQSVRYERLTENSTYVTPGSTSTCTNSSGVVVDACAMGTTETGNWPGQIMTRRTRYARGDFEFTTTQWAAWLQDDIEIGRLNLRPGARVDSDDYMDKTTWSPRFAVRYDLFADNSTVFNAGANRYYGRNITGLRLKEGRNRLRYNGEQRNTVNDTWTVGVNAADNMKFNQLDIPYDDELMFGIEQRWKGLKFDAKYVKRKGRDQITQVRGAAIGQPSTDPASLSNTYTTWTNDKKTDTDILSLTIAPLQDLRWRGTRTTGQLVFDWVDSKTNANAPDYTEEVDLDKYIQYKGKIIREIDRPADNYTRPWTLRLATITQIPQWNLTWSNFLRYRAAYSAIGQTVASNRSGVVDHKNRPVAIFGKRKFNNALTWDIRLGWEFPTARDQAFFVNVDVFNVLDKKSASEFNSATETTTYEVGRQFWLEVGYRF